MKLLLLTLIFVCTASCQKIDDIAKSAVDDDKQLGKPGIAQTATTLNKTANQTNNAPPASDAKITHTSASENKTAVSTLNTTAVPVLDTGAPLNDILCINNFGRCLNKDSLSDCANTSVVFYGVCGNEEIICCVENQEVQKSWTNNDTNCAKIFGKCRVDTKTCEGVMDLATCGGPSHRKCCSPGQDQMDKWTTNDTSCLEKMGNCQSSMLSCKGNFKVDMCGGPSHRKCCLPSTNTQKKWKSHDEECYKKWGSCQSDKTACLGGAYEKGLCGGPDVRECCVPSVDTIKSWEPKDTNCTNKFGACQHRIESCNGTMDEENEMCNGPQSRICCSPSESTTKSWIEDDDACIKEKGKCQHSSSDCIGSYKPSCGGPDERQCCIPQAKPTENKELLPPPASSSPSSLSPSSSSSSSKPSTKTILLIVAGVLMGVVLVATVITLVKRGTFKSYKRVRNEGWYDRSGFDERVNLTSCEDEKGTYA